MSHEDWIRLCYEPGVCFICGPAETEEFGFCKRRQTDCMFRSKENLEARRREVELCKRILTK